MRVWRTWWAEEGVMAGELATWGMVGGDGREVWDTMRQEWEWLLFSIACGSFYNCSTLFVHV